jgi:hypothetical protein
MHRSTRARKGIRSLWYTHHWKHPLAKYRDFRTTRSCKSPHEHGLTERIRCSIAGRRGKLWNQRTSTCAGIILYEHVHLLLFFFKSNRCCRDTRAFTEAPQRPHDAPPIAGKIMRWFSVRARLFVCFRENNIPQKRKGGKRNQTHQLTRNHKRKVNSSPCKKKRR